MSATQASERPVNIDVQYDGPQPRPPTQYGVPPQPYPPAQYGAPPQPQPPSQYSQHGATATIGVPGNAYQHQNNYDGSAGEYIDLPKGRPWGRRRKEAQDTSHYDDNIRQQETWEIQQAINAVVMNSASSASDSSVADEPDTLSLYVYRHHTASCKSWCIREHHEEHKDIRAIIDPCARDNFISEAKAKDIHWPYRSTENIWTHWNDESDRDISAPSHHVDAHGRVIGMDILGRVSLGWKPHGIGWTWDDFWVVKHLPYDIIFKSVRAGDVELKTCELLRSGYGKDKRPYRASAWILEETQRKYYMAWYDRQNEVVYTKWAD